MKLAVEEIKEEIKEFEFKQKSIKDSEASPQEQNVLTKETSEETKTIVEALNELLIKTVESPQESVQEVLVIVESTSLEVEATPSKDEVEIEKVGSDENSNAEIVKEDDFEMIEKTEIEIEIKMIEKAVHIEQVIEERGSVEVEMTPTEQEIEIKKEDSDENSKTEIEALIEAEIQNAEETPAQIEPATNFGNKSRTC